MKTVLQKRKDSKLTVGLFYNCGFRAYCIDLFSQTNLELCKTSLLNKQDQEQNMYLG